MQSSGSIAAWATTWFWATVSSLAAMALDLRRKKGAGRKLCRVVVTVLGDAVEVQSNACIDRASIGETVIARGTKIDNLVQVGHGSKVGEDTLLCAQVGLAGSSIIGNRVILAGQVGVAGALYGRRRRG